MFCGTWTKVLLLLAKRGNRLPLREKVVLGGIMYPHASPKSCSLMNSSHVIFSCYPNSQKCDNNSVNYKSNPVRVKKNKMSTPFYFLALLHYLSNQKKLFKDLSSQEKGCLIPN
jgi:hypothetical protein